MRRARVETLRAALDAAAACPGAETAALVRHSYELQLRRAEEEAAGDGADTDETPSEGAAAAAAKAACTDGAEADALVLRAATEAGRRRLVSLRDDGTIGDAAFQRVEEELDWAELGWAQLDHAGRRTNGEA